VERHIVVPRAANNDNRLSRPPRRAAAARRPLPPQSHAETVYDALKKDILNGTLAPGAILREEDLARRHRVSRTPVRAALSRLETEGLATRHSGTGLLVSELGPDEIIDLYVLREALEGLAVRLAARRWTEVDMARLNLLNDLAQQAVRDRDTARASRFNAEFHAVIWRASGNRPLLKAINGVHESIQRFPQNTLAYPGRLDRSVDEHTRMLEAIRERDHVKAEALAIEHVRNVRNIRMAISLEHEVQDEVD
jgi:DNA-binding GntR family transcriptional regulator